MALGLFVGKPLGVVAGAWIAVRLGAQLPVGVAWPGVFAVGVVAGIGFTVALFVAQLAYADSRLLADAMVGIFVGSAAAGVIGFVLLCIVSEALDD